MTIITVFDADVRKERGWDFPGYPEGVWTAGGVASHDASGGIMVIQVNVQTAGVPEGNAYSVEALEYQTNSAAIVDLQLQAANFDFSGGLTLTRGYQLDPHNQSTGDAVLRANSFGRPWFLGQIVTRANASALSLVVDNVTGDISIFHLGGYFWTPRSILQAEGGFRRPPDGLYSR